MKALEGKRIGQVPGSWVAVLFALAARANGVNREKVDMVNIPLIGSTQLQALKSGDIDGVVTWPPNSDAAIVQASASIRRAAILDRRKNTGPGIDCFGEFNIPSGQKDSINFMKSYVESMNYYVQNPDKAVELITEYSSAPKVVVTEALKHGRWTVHVDLKALANVARAGPSFGFTKTDQSDRVANVVDLDPLSEATGESVQSLSTLQLNRSDFVPAAVAPQSGRAYKPAFAMTHLKRWVGRVAVVLFWQFAASVHLLDEHIVPAPSTVLVAWREWFLGARTELSWSSGTWLPDVLLSTRRVAIGFTISAALGIPLGLMIGWNREGCRRRRSFRAAAATDPDHRLAAVRRRDLRDSRRCGDLSDQLRRLLPDRHQLH